MDRTLNTLRHVRALYDLQLEETRRLQRELRRHPSGEGQIMRVELEMVELDAIWQSPHPDG
jgi:hypothetical protein